MARLKATGDLISERYINRELSWLHFNSRVLAEAENPDNPLLERARFLSIFESNLDEFYMVRVSGLIEQFESGVMRTSPDGLTPSDQLKLIAASAVALRKACARILSEKLLPELEASGIRLVDYDTLTRKRKQILGVFFRREVFPLCTPLILHPSPSVPFISNRSLNLAVELTDGTDVRLARVKIPSILPRLVRVTKRRHEYLMLEDLVANHLDALFPGVHVSGSWVFRVIRDADIEIRELEASDLISSIEESLRLRRFGDPVLLEHSAHMPVHVRAQLMQLLQLDEEDTFSVPGMLGLESLTELAKIDRPSLRYPPFLPHIAEALGSYQSLFESITAGDVFVHHPYDGFRSVEAFVASAAKDPSVVGIKQTLYRVGAESPVVESLAEAAELGKQVAACVELKARFDESNNLVWSRALERAGAHVTYGFAELKTHCKLSLVLRKETNGLKAYAHVGTGNYNPSTARQYTDLGLFTCNPEITQDVSELFNFLTGFSKQVRFRRLLVAPINLREGILERIARESKLANKGKSARIVLKLNALVDPEVIDALYEASLRGVQVDLIIRGICCLRPQVAGLSERIRVISVIGRFLEHSRIYYFENGGSPDVLIGSADAMRRNLDRRVEVLVPIDHPGLVAHIRDEILEVYLRDTVRAWELGANNMYERRTPPKGEAGFFAQDWLMSHPPTKSLYGRRFAEGPTHPSGLTVVER